MSVANLLTTGNVLDTGGETQNPTFQTVTVTSGVTVNTGSTGYNPVLDSYPSYLDWKNATIPDNTLVSLNGNGGVSGSIAARQLLLPLNVGNPAPNPMAIITALGVPGTSTGVGVTKVLVDFPGGAQFDYANQSGNVALPASSPASVTVACPGVLPTSLIQVTPLADVTAASQIYVVPGTDSFDIKATTGPAANANIAWFVHKY